MKAGALILFSLVVGALAAVVVIGRSSAGEAVQPGAAARTIVEPRLEWPAPRTRAKPSPLGAPLINVPKLHLRARIGTNLDDGPAWWPVTGRPGGGDTVAIAGHRTTHTRPFYWLDRLEPGDSIYVRFGGRTRAYAVSGRRILSSKNLHIADARGYEILLLSACTPRGSARQRIVVYARPRAS
jgi:LPXTG-site transpeptidase (sortase) family protein